MDVSSRKIEHGLGWKLLEGGGSGNFADDRAVDPLLSASLPAGETKAKAWPPLNTL